VPDEARGKEAQGYMYIRLGSYLAETEELERRKPEGQRRPVPTITELASAAGVNKATVSRLLSGETGALNLDMGRAIFDELYRRGFQPSPGDLIAYRPPDSPD
jgi:DNA-binding Xre family transcriptional regulator